MIHPSMIRNPVTPLPYEQKDHAQPKELIIDYSNGSLYYYDEEGNLIDITLGLITRLPASSISFTNEDGVKIPLQDIIVGMKVKDSILNELIDNLSTTKQENITGAASTVTTTNLTPSRVIIVGLDGKITVSEIDTTKLNQLTNITGDVQAQINELGTTKQNNITGAASTITNENLMENYALVTDENGKIAASTVTKVELGALHGIKGNIQNQLDNIPKLTYLNSVSAGTIADDSTQEQINAVCIGKIQEIYGTPVLWNAVNVSFTFATSDILKNALYYYNGTTWLFLYYTTTGVQRANGTTAGIVENSDDITFNDGKATIIADIIRYTVNDLGLTDKEIWTAAKLITELGKKQATITGAASTVVSSNLAVDTVLISDGNGKIIASTISKTILNYLTGLNSNAQEQIDAKLNKGGNTVSRAIMSDSAGNIVPSTVTSTELSYLKGLTSNIKAQLDSKFGSMDDVMSFVIGNIMMQITAKHSGACVGDNMTAVSMGGLNASTALATTEIFNSLTWRSSANMLSAKYSLGAVGESNTVLAFGGTVNNAVSALTEQFNGTDWTAKPNMNTARTRIAGCGRVTNALAVGYSANPEQFNGTTWSVLSNALNTARYDLALCGTTNAALAMAGTNISTGAKLSSCEIFNGTTWTVGPIMGNTRASLAGFGNAMDAVAVCGNTGSVTNVGEYFNGIAWVAINGSIYPREKCEGNSSSSIGGTASSSGIIAAGINGTNYTQYTEAFNGVRFRSYSSLGDSIYEILGSKFDKSGGRIEGRLDANIVNANKVYSAVWNDYAECRQSVISYRPGTVVVESNSSNDDGYLMVSTKRLQSNAKVVTDTYGFSLGAKCIDGEFSIPLALSGRVLAYTDKNRDTFHKGDTVCSGRDGTISKMSRLETIVFPDRIIGTVSSVPTRTEWEGIEIDNRIWINIK